jgi:hypothetical protein
MIPDDQVQLMKWKLSYIERILDVNITCFVRLEGSFGVNQLRPALARVQHKHPVLRALIREERDGLYYEADSAPEIPLRIVARVSGQDYWRECQTELATSFPPDQPQLRVVWLRAEQENELLFTTTHRMCDGMSILNLVREVLRALHDDEELIPYEPVTVHDIIRDYRPSKPWKHKLATFLINGVLRLIPSSRRPPENHEHHLEWSAGLALSAALKQRCKAEGVSVHAFFAVALERALFLTFGRKLPKTIVSPIDVRGGRFTALKSDTVLFGGGDIKVRACPSLEAEFWARARAVHKDIRKELKRELRDLPVRLHFLEKLRPLSTGQIRWIMRLSDAMKLNASRFGLSNLGNVATSGRDVPSSLIDLRLYLHSFSFRTFGLVPYIVNGEMRFYFSIDERCMSRSQADKLQREFITVLQNQSLCAAGQEAEALSREVPVLITRSDI